MDTLGKIKGAVSDSGLDAILIKNEHNRFYATGFRSSAGSVLVTAREAFFFTDSRYIEAARENIKDMTIGLIDSSMKESSWLCQAVHDCGIKTLGFEEQTLSYASFQKLGQEIKSVNLKPAQELIKTLRASKEPSEIDAITEAQRIAESVFSTILRDFRQGVTELELAAELSYKMALAGAQKNSFEPIVLFGKKTSMPHGQPSNVRIEGNGFLLLDFGCIVRGYCSDMTRTVAIGNATEEMRRIYGFVLEAQKAGIAAARSGISGRNIDAAARQVIETAGFGKFFSHGFGHSLGLEIHETPSASPTEECLMPERAVISAEPGIYLEGKFGVRIEDMLLLNKDGNENLTLAPKELIVI